MFHMWVGRSIYIDFHRGEKTATLRPNRLETKPRHRMSNNITPSVPTSVVTKLLEKRTQEVMKRRRKAETREWNRFLTPPQTELNITNALIEHESNLWRHPALARIVCEEMLID
jgi:hypothetical protein